MSSSGGARKRVATKVDAKKASLTPKSDTVEKPILPDFNPLLPKYQFDEHDQTIDFALSAKRVKHSDAYEPNSHSFAAETRRIGLLQALSLCANASIDTRTVIIDMYGSIRTFNMLMQLSERSKKKYVYVLAYGQFTPKDGNRYTSGDLEAMLKKARLSHRISVILIELLPGSFYSHLTTIREKIYNLGPKCPRYMLLGDVYQVSSSTTETIPISHQHFTQTVLSSLLALPHHSSFDELLLAFKEQPELDLVLKSKVAEDIEASFKEKFAVTWGTVSTVIDYQNIYAKRYKLETSEVKRLISYLTAPVIIHQDLARISYKILSVDYC